MDGHENSKRADDIGDSSSAGIDIDDSLQDDLCKLWDMSMNPVRGVFVLFTQNILSRQD